MGRTPCCSKDGMNRGAWTAQEDQILKDHINTHGEGKWRSLPKLAGLKRCGKSCRLRWLNYLRPDIKRGNISEEEEDLIIRLHKLLGNRWSLIAGRLPGRTDNEVKNYWNTTLRKKIKGQSVDQKSKERSPTKPQQPTVGGAADGACEENVIGGGGFQNLVVPSDSFDVDEFLLSDISGPPGHLDLWKPYDRREFYCDGLDGSHGCGFPSSSCQPVLFSEETLMEYWTDVGIGNDY